MAHRLLKRDAQDLRIGKRRHAPLVERRRVEVEHRAGRHPPRAPRALPHGRLRASVLQRGWKPNLEGSARGEDTTPPLES